MGTYTSPAINYYRINANNTALAQSNSGGGNPTDEITAPVASPGTFSSYDSGTLTINGSATTVNSFAVGQYLYYTDTTTGNYVLVGQIATITSNTALVLANTSSQFLSQCLTRSISISCNRDVRYGI